MVTVTAADLKKGTTEVLKRVAAGEDVVVTVRGKAVALVKRVARRGRPRKAATGIKELIREGAGMLAGLGSVDEFLAERRNEVKRERAKWRATR